MSLPTYVNLVEVGPRDGLQIHDTYGQGLVNVYTALTYGINTIDTAIAGLGGCPYAKGAAGNVATEDVLWLLNGLKIKTGVDLGQLQLASHFICQALGIAPISKVAKARGM